MSVTFRLKPSVTVFEFEISNSKKFQTAFHAFVGRSDVSELAYGDQFPSGLFSFRWRDLGFPNQNGPRPFVSAPSTTHLRHEQKG